jgi:prevent-host-death family protein
MPKKAKSLEKGLDIYSQTGQTIIMKETTQSEAMHFEVMYPAEESPYWQLQEAKAMFSKVVKSAKLEPQIITVHGKEEAAVISMENNRKQTSPKESLVSFMEKSPWADVKLDLPGRTIEKTRKIDL